MAIDPETKAYLDANNAEIMAEYQKLWEQQQQSVEEQRAQMTGSMYTQLGFYQAGKEADNALMFMQEWGANINRRAELTARDGIPPPPDDPNGTSMDSGILFTGDDGKNWDAIGDIFNPKKPEGS
ncbi:MAG TPA: hypothetical protein VLJ37_11210 [bacterium]|nr:hypothetical protein [bacterium]